MKKLLLALVVICGGCMIVPTPPIPHNTGGHQYRPEDITFLDEPGMSRSNVVDYLGTPDWIVKEPPVIAYVWEMSVTHGVWFFFGGEFHSRGGELAKAQRWALFIALDEYDRVSRHAICVLVDNKTVEENAASWFNTSR
jgi:hypothetical protein